LKLRKIQTIVGQIDEVEKSSFAAHLPHHAKALVEVVLTEEGKFRRAASFKRIITTIIPCTESSSGVQR
jgi:hypothetical protein